MKDKKILVVDFDEESLISLSNLVFEEGFQAVTAMDGLSGYEKFKAEDFDLVIIEPMLPKLHGFELMKRINQTPNKKTPIMIVTGIYREPSCKMEALQVYGASAYFTKPWNRDDLRAKMLSLLVNGQQDETPKPEPQVKKPEAVPPAPVKVPTGPLIDEWGLLKPQAPPHEPKPDKGLEDIERELRAVASGMAAPVRRKEPVKEVQREKREAKAGGNVEIEAMLKTAIGGLGLEDKKRKPEHAVRPAPVSRPEPKVEKPEKKEKITIAKEIKERIPLHDNAGNNIPHPSARAAVYAEKTPFGIDQTLIEIDKIPLEMDKPAPGPEKAAPEKVERVVTPKKRAYFDEFSETEKKKPPLGLIGGLAAALLVVGGSTFLVLKSKKPKEAEPQMVSSLQASLPDEFAIRQNEVGAPPDSRPSETRPESKRAQAQADALETAKQIQPALPAQSTPVGLEIQIPPSPGPDDQASEQAEAPKTENNAPAETPAEVQAQRPEPQAAAPVAVKPNPGDLLPLEQVDVPPALIKRVDPKYPLQAFNMGISGTVVVNALIAETGDVLRTEILQGVKGGYGFEKSAEAAVRQWKFRPAEKSGVPVRVWKSMDINFKMSPTPKR